MPQGAEEPFVLDVPRYFADVQGDVES